MFLLTFSLKLTIIKGGEEIHTDKGLNMTLKQPNYRLKNRMSDICFLLYAVGILTSAGMIFYPKAKVQKVGVAGLVMASACAVLHGASESEDRSIQRRSKDGYGY